METKVFKVGDRVAIYSSERMVGVVDAVQKRGYWCFVEIKGKAYWQGLVHPKQLRRLKPKKRREFWIYPNPVGPNTSRICESFHLASLHPDRSNQMIHVLEVRNDSQRSQKG